VLRRVLLIAKRDYLQTVRSKAYLVGLILLPLLFGGGFLVLPFANRGNNTKNMRVVIVDRTGIAASAVIQAAEESNRKAMAAAPFGSQSVAHFFFEEVKPETDHAAQLVLLSNQIRNGEVFAVLDIPPDALGPLGGPNRQRIAYYTNSGGIVDQLGLWLPTAVNDGLRRVRLAQLGVDPARVPAVLGDVAVVSMNLASKNRVTGNIVQTEKRNPVQAGAIPFFLVFLLIMIALVGAAPNLGAVAQDKMQRVFEMLLSSASSFELMMGKVLAALGTSLTSSTFYILGGLAVLAGMAMFGLAPLNLLPWFFVYLIADVVMLSALGVALGSACASPQDAQHLSFLLVLPVMIPMFVLTPVMLQPNGPLAVVMSFIPPFTPVIMLLRQALPGGVPWWQPWLALLGVIAWAGAMIWAAARVFRIGILSQGKTPKLGELMQWVLRD
jgi:ABC-2 type transport system permease protein